MSDLKDVSPISGLTAMTVLSLATGNKIGQILDLFIDPINGVLLGVTALLADGRVAGIMQDEIYNFGKDAVMVRSDESIVPLESGALAGGRQASKLVGTKIITESGDVLGHITNIFVTLKPPPHILYEARQSILDKLLGREFFLPASVGYALSDDGARLVVPDVTPDIAASDLGSLLSQHIEVRSFDDAGGGRVGAAPPTREDDTIPILLDDADETVVRSRDEDETVVRLGDDDDDTVVRRPRR
ncbi:MAG TPA: hypothetical protein VMZ26_06670 [Pyrinomonadaceae bacterium]|nr:hypothetical protein [Pyrinomonadaceae bacterium]